MAFKILAEAVDEKLASIATVLTRIEHEGGWADLRSLSLHLIEAMSLFQRNPGIEAAADDLYAAAVAVVADGLMEPQLNTRTLRILKEAHRRFRSRLEGAAERIGPYEYLVVPQFPTREAA
jgi:hypothetical protein